MSNPVPAETGKISQTSPFRRYGKRILRTVVVAYVLVLVLMYFFQTYMIFPGTFRQGTGNARVCGLDGETMVKLKTPDGTALGGALWGGGFAASSGIGGDGAADGDAVLWEWGLHGGGAVSGGDFPVDVLQLHAGGLSGVWDVGREAIGGGVLCGGGGGVCVCDGDPDVDRTRMVLTAGWSLGGGVAIELLQASGGWSVSGAGDVFVVHVDH